METGVLSALQLTSMFPNLILENFYVKTKHSMEAGSTSAPFGYVFPVQRDMTRVAALINVLRAQGIEVGTLNADVTVGTDKYPAGSYLIKMDQPYGRLVKNLLERQDYPDPALTTYDDSGWSMGYAFNVDVKEVKEKSILSAATSPVKTAVVRGKVTGTGTAGLAVAHYGSNNMISFRYRLKNIPMKIAEAQFSAEGVTFPAGSFIVTGSAADIQAARAQVEALGLSAAALSAVPTVATHDANVPRVAIYSQWSGTQELGWYRHTFDQFGIPFDLIYKERIAKGNLKNDYDVILMAAQNINRAAVLAPPAARAQPYQKTDKFKFLGMYGESADISGGFGQAGVEAIEKFLDGGGTLITTLQAVRFPIEFGLARSIDTEAPTGVNAQKPLIQAEIVRTNHPVFYGYENKIFPIKFGQGSQVFRVGVADQANVLAQYVGGDASVLSGLMVGADNLRGRAFAADVPNAHNGKGRVIMFANNPDLSLAEPRRVQHGVQLDPQLGRRSRTCADGRAGCRWRARWARRSAAALTRTARYTTVPSASVKPSCYESLQRADTSARSVILRPHLPPIKLADLPDVGSRHRFRRTPSCDQSPRRSLSPPSLRSPLSPVRQATTSRRPHSRPGQRSSRAAFQIRARCRTSSSTPSRRRTIGSCASRICRRISAAS